MLASSSYFGGMEHGSAMGSRYGSRDHAFQDPGDLDSAAYTMSSNYEQAPMMSSNSAMFGLGGEPFRSEFGEKIGTMLGMETMFDGNLSSNVSQTNWWSDLEQFSPQNALGMNLLYTAPQDVFSSGAYDIGSSITPGREIMRTNQDFERAPSQNLHSPAPSKNTHLLNASRSCSPTRMRLRKRQWTRSGIIDERLIRHKRDTKPRKDRRPKERAFAILEIEFRFNPQPDQQTMQDQARLIGSTFDDVSQWFDRMRRRGLQSNPNQDRLGLSHTEPSSRDQVSSIMRTRKDPEDHSGLIQISVSKKSRKERNAAWSAQKKKWQCTTSSCMKPLKNRSEWIRHENTHGQPSEVANQLLNVRGGLPPAANIRQAKVIGLSGRTSSKNISGSSTILCYRHPWFLAGRNKKNPDSRSRCGFCGEDLESWEMRLSHIAEHFENGWEMSSWNEKLAEELSDEEEEEEEGNDEDMSDFDEMEEDSDDENGDASLDGSPNGGVDNENQDEDSGDRGPGDANDTNGNGYWQDFSPSTRNPSSFTTANPNSYYALVAIIYYGNFRHNVYTSERPRLSATFHTVSNSQLPQFYVATFHTNQGRITSFPSEPPREDILVPVTELTLPKGASSLSLLQSAFSSPRQQRLAKFHQVQALTSGPSLLHKTIYTSQGSREFRTTMKYLLPDHHPLRRFHRVSRSSWPHNVDNFPFYMFPGLRGNVRGLLCHGSGRGSQTAHDNAPHAIQDVTCSAANCESIRFTVNRNSSNNPMPKVAINPSPANLHNFADTLSDVNHVPVTREFSTSSISNKDISGESSLYLDFRIPYERNKNFVGRGSILRSMKQALKMDTSQRIVLQGMGGVGKTQIALEFASRYRAEFTSIVWVNTWKTSTINSQRGPATTEHLIKQLNADSSPWLLILDDDDDDISKFGDLWCSQSSGSIITTTRNENFDSPFKDTNHTRRISRFEVTPFENEESVELFRKRACLAGQTAVDDQDLGRLIELLEGLPLALAQAASYIQMTNTSISQYLNLFNAEKEKLLDCQIGLEEDTTLRSQSISEEKVRDEYSPDLVPKSVATTWQISFNQIKSKDSAATSLLSLSLYDDINKVHGGLEKRTGATSKLEDQASSSQPPLTSQLRHRFPDQLATFSEQQIKEGLNLLLDMSMVVLSYAATMVEVPRQSKEAMQFIAQSSKNKMVDFLRPGLGVIS
ncbi:hypothetical protein G7Y89_g9674 [Cudoniella acicularis]|uniref:Homeobox domain-containing protein n=1 Tax=Cudoniella acicularis TaxID=354080 RepID=A0A8H4RE72_9HELO|nr:hypothetical protein G7Y89_g9674 [Cudoniella acicularis]